MERSYGVQELAQMAGVSVRTLHYYDEIGILTPAARSEAGYRRYGHDEALRLQQILFYRELDVPLARIREILLDPQFDQLGALQRHREALRARAARTAALLETLDRTIDQIRGVTMLSDQELYKGFTPDQIERYQTEAKAAWPEEYASVDAKVRTMSPEQWEAIQAEGDAINRELAARVGEDPASADVQALVARHHAWIEHFYEADAGRYRGLAEMYVTDERFRDYYERYAPGLAELLADAMKRFAGSRL